MDFATDAHFLIGQAHIKGGKPCQDYATSGTLGNSAYAVVSDGCSTGGLTDVGSRIVTLTSVRAIKGCAQLAERFGPGQISLVRGDGIKQASLILGLKTEDMLATCIYAYITPEGGFIQLEGDGVIALKYRNGEIKMLRYDWADNTPFYMAYSENLIGFIQAHGGDLKANRLSKQSWVFGPDKRFVELPAEEITLENGIRGITVPISAEELNDLEFVTIFTDGVTQVKELGWKEAVIELLSFKTSEGEFAKRRMNMMVKDAMKHGQEPIDDISFAVINIKPEQ